MKLESKPTAAVLVLNNDKILVIKHSANAAHLTGSYGIPGGHIEPNETDKEAAVRELFEESGLKADVADLIEFPGNFFEAKLIQKQGLRNFTWRVFLCQKFTGELKPGPEGEPEWITEAELNQLTLLANTRDVYLNAKKFLNK